jgi:hypothetical protein
MIEVRTKDKFFICVVLPVIAAIAYFAHFRNAETAKMKSLRDKDFSTVSEEAYPVEKNIRLSRLKEAEAKLQEEKSVAPSREFVVADNSLSVSHRTRNVVQVFRKSSLTVEEVAKVKDIRGGRAENVLRSTLAMENPVRRAYRIDGGFSSLKAAVDEFADKKFAVIIAQLELQGIDKWRLELYE